MIRYLVLFSVFSPLFFTSCSTTTSETGHPVVDAVQEHIREFRQCYNNFRASKGHPFTSIVEFKYSFFLGGLDHKLDLNVTEGYKSPNYLKCLEDVSKKVVIKKNVCRFYNHKCPRESSAMQFTYSLSFGPIM